MKILFISSLSYPPQDLGGSKSSTHELCKVLLARNHNAALLCGLQNEGLFGLWTRIRRKMSRKNEFPLDFYLGYPTFRGWNVKNGIPEVIRRFKPDIVIVDAGETMSLARAMLDHRIPTIVSIRDVEFHKMGEMPFHDSLIAYISNSDFTASVLKDRFQLSSTVIPPIVDPDKYKTISSRQAILHINPHPDKGIDITLRLASLRPDIPFTIIESWKLSNQLLDPYREEASTLPNVSWRERSFDMRKIYADARIILVPSRCNEAWGRIATEAHVNGIPVIASSRGGLPESVGPGGILIDADASIDSWLRAISQLWDDPIEYSRVSDKAISYSKRPEINPNNIVNKYISTLEDHLQHQSDLT